LSGYFTQWQCGKGKPMQGKPVFQARFVARKQGLEAVEPGIHLLNDQPTAVEFGVEWRVVVCLPVRCSPVARNVGLDASGSTSLP